MILVALALGATDARAQMGAFKGFLSGYVGTAVGGELDGPSAAVGASISVHDDTGWGAEFDLGHSSGAQVDNEPLDITTYMVNAIWAQPVGFVRPFGTIGAGVLQVNGCDATCSRSARTFDFGISAGGGVLAELNDAFAVRADARYFFSSADHPDLRRPDSMGFWRLTFGATYMWSAAP
jgi:hypothetical protein